MTTAPLATLPTALTAPRTVFDLIAVAEETGQLRRNDVYGNRGQYRLHFRNGWVMSIGFGPNYAGDNHGRMMSVEGEITLYMGPPGRDPMGWSESTTAEVMVIKPAGTRMIWPDNEDGILFDQPVESVAALIRMVAVEGMP